MNEKYDYELHAKLLEEKIKSKLVFEGKILKLYYDRVRLPNNKIATREKVSHPGAVAVVPVNENKEVFLVKQFRYPLEKVLIEIPAGKLDSNEPPVECAKRELREEAGLVGGKLTHLVTIYTSPGFSDEKMEIYLAMDFMEESNHPDHDEFLHIFKAGMHDCLGMIKNGEITDAKSIIGIMCARDFISGLSKQ